MVHIIKFGIGTSSTVVLACTDLRCAFSHIPLDADASQGCFMMDLTTTFPALAPIVRPLGRYRIVATDVVVFKNQVCPPNRAIRLSVVCQYVDDGHDKQASPRLQLSTETYIITITGGALGLDLEPEFEQGQLTLSIRKPFSYCSIQHSCSGRILVELTRLQEEGKNRSGVALNFSEIGRAHV